MADGDSRSTSPLCDMVTSTPAQRTVSSLMLILLHPSSNSSSASSYSYLFLFLSSCSSSFFSSASSLSCSCSYSSSCSSACSYFFHHLSISCSSDLHLLFFLLHLLTYFFVSLPLSSPLPAPSSLFLPVPRLDPHVLFLLMFFLLLVFIRLIPLLPSASSFIYSYCSSSYSYFSFLFSSCSFNTIFSSSSYSFQHLYLL